MYGQTISDDGDIAFNIACNGPVNSLLIIVLKSTYLLGLAAV